MNFEWSAYLNLAEQLLNSASNPIINQADREAMLRTAISRAYYAAFVSARNHLRENYGDKFVPASGDAHSYVANQFRNSPNQWSKKIGWKLHFLRKYRNMADYDNVFQNLLLNATTSILEAKRSLNILDRLK